MNIRFISDLVIGDAVRLVRLGQHMHGSNQLVLEEIKEFKVFVLSWGMLKCFVVGSVIVDRSSPPVSDLSTHLAVLTLQRSREQCSLGTFDLNFLR